MIITRKELRDQGAHLGIAFATVMILKATGLPIIWWQGIVIGLAMAAPREHAQHGFRRMFSTPGSARDGAAWMLGGALAGIVPL